MSDFFRFPHTPHVAWLGEDSPRDDKVLAPDEVEELLSHDLVAEEKIDGANIGFSVGPDGDLRVQNRGSYLTREFAHAQFKPLWAWLASRKFALIDALGPDLMLFGEWCVAKHSVAYDKLPDWFLGFDIYDRSTGLFWDTVKRDALLADNGLCSVPRLGEGKFSVESIEGLIATSRVGSGACEGVVVRRELDGATERRAKLVRASFTQAIEEHWSRRAIERNELAPGAKGW